MPTWLNDVLEKSNYFMPHGHCYLWMPQLLWLHVISDALIGAAYIGIAAILWILVRRIRLPFSPVFIAFGLFIALCGATHFMEIWTVWNPDYVQEGLLKAATALASVATAIGLYFVRPQVEAVVHAARLSEERRIRLESTHAELETLYARLREADELKSRFFANISHELRTPLALMLGPAEQMQHDPGLDETRRRRLRMIAANGQVLLKQVNDLLDVARLEAGRMELDYAHVDVAAWARRLCSQFEAAADAQRITLTVDAPATLPAEVDPDKLERVLVNLLSNALKFTPDGGRVDVQLRGDDDTVELAVADSGPGIPPSQREVIFERFRQADAGDTRRFGGTGLGLAIVRDFVELHRGAVDVTDAAIGGARLQVTLPRRAPAGASVRADAGPVRGGSAAAVVHELQLARAGSDDARPQQAGRATVLVVEDNADMRRFVADTLADEHNVIVAADGEQGLERAQALLPDLVVTDLMMPGLSGAELVRALRAQPRFAATPILLLSAKADDTLRVQLLAEGAQDYVVKPFIADELRARARNLVAGKRARDLLRDELASLSTDLDVLAGELVQRNHQLRDALAAAEAAREEAERSSSVKSYFLGLMSHELRTPLTTIQLNLQLLARDDGGDPAAARARLERLHRASQQLGILVDGVLEYTRLQSGRIDVHHEAVDPAALGASLVQEYAPSRADGVQLRLQPPPALPPCHTDPRLLRVVLGNLLANALKFTREGEVSLQLSMNEHGHVFTVHDTGIGIEPADLPRIFEPFEQLEPLRGKSIPGVGLGLALVRQIVDALGGRVEVHSQPGHGSRFVVTVPSRSVESRDEPM